ETTILSLLYLSPRFTSLPFPSNSFFSLLCVAASERLLPRLPFFLVAADVVLVVVVVALLFMVLLHFLFLVLVSNTVDDRCL
ncbi:hypothetical protein SOVF_101450, partial [Spinacia oleracea]